MSRWESESFEADMGHEVKRQRREDGADDRAREQRYEDAEQARYDARDDEREARHG